MKEIENDTSQINWAELAQEAGFYDENQTPSQKKVVVARKDARERQRKVMPETVIIGEEKILAGSRFKEFRRIPYHPDYFVSIDGVVKNIDGQTLRGKRTSADTQVALRVGRKFKNVYRFKLVHDTWPEVAPVYHTNYFTYQNEPWRYVEGFPGYAISISGTVIRLKNFIPLHPRQGRVLMSKDGRQIARAVNRLMLENFTALPGDILQLRENPRYAIVRQGRIINLETLHTIKSNDFGSAVTGTTKNGVRTPIYFATAELLTEYFGA